jgi:hypothetical protein
MTTAPETLTAALAYLQAGISLIPVRADGTKQPEWELLPRTWSPAIGCWRHGWKEFQTRLPTPAEATSWFMNSAGPFGMAAVCGHVSGGLEMIDFDQAELIHPWAVAVGRASPVLLGKLIIVQTPRPGFHVYFRSSFPSRNMVLARRQSIDPASGQQMTKALIETRGEGGCCIVPPSPAACHPSGRAYQYLLDSDLTRVSTLTVAEKVLLFRLAGRLDEMPAKPATVSFDNTRLATTPRLRPLSVGNDVNERGRWDEILLPLGWTLVAREPSGVCYWRRPGKTDGTSATTNYGGRDLLHVFSSSVSPLEPGKSYNKFATLALLYFGGSFARAARELAKRGFGSRR